MQVASPAETQGIATPVGRALIELIAAYPDFREIAKTILFSGTNVNEPGIIYLNGVAWKEEDVYYMNLETNEKITGVGMGECIAPLKQMHAFMLI